MKKQLRTWTLRITATALLVAALLLTIILYPVLTYANRSTYQTYTIYHNQPLDQATSLRLREARALVKACSYYDASLQTDICLDEGSVYPRWYASWAAMPLPVAFTIKWC